MWSYVYACVWCRHDFVVVETIGFEDGEEEDLPPPLSLKELIALNKNRDVQAALAAEAAQEAAKVRRSAAVRCALQPGP